MNSDFSYVPLVSHHGVLFRLPGQSIAGFKRAHIPKGVTTLASSAIFHRFHLFLEIPDFLLELDNGGPLLFQVILLAGLLGNRELNASCLAKVIGEVFEVISDVFSDGLVQIVSLCLCQKYHFI